MAGAVAACPLFARAEGGLPPSQRVAPPRLSLPLFCRQSPSPRRSALDPPQPLIPHRTRSTIENPRDRIDQPPRPPFLIRRDNPLNSHPMRHLIVLLLVALLALVAMAPSARAAEVKKDAPAANATDAGE